MAVIGLSLLAAVVGGLATWRAIRTMASGPVEHDPHVYWALGLGALVPGWLIVFLALLGPTIRPQVDPVLEVSWVGSTATALAGVIATEARVRRAMESEPSPSAGHYWRLGLLGLVPAWALALLGYGWRAVGL